MLDQVRAFRGIYTAAILLPCIVTPIVGTLIYRQTFDLYGTYPCILDEVFGIDINFFATSNIMSHVIFHAIW